jgi:phage gpG-like protein
MTTIDVSQFTRHVAQQAEKIRRYVERDAPRVIAIEAVNHFKKNFMNQGFTDESNTPWKPAKRTQPASEWYGFLHGARTPLPDNHPRRKDAKSVYKPRKPKPITNYSPAAAKRRTLSGMTGDLKESIKYRLEPRKAIIYSDLIYANVHNEGLEASVFGKKKFKMPKRQFIGESARLNERIMALIKKDINNIVNG